MKEPPNGTSASYISYAGLEYENLLLNVYLTAEVMN
jgi:hypothetical protein